MRTYEQRMTDLERRFNCLVAALKKNTDAEIDLLEKSREPTAPTWLVVFCAASITGNIIMTIYIQAMLWSS